MRILCDQNVAQKYTETFRRTDWITITTVREELTPEAPDDEIGRYAAANDWIVFTEDDDHLEYEQDRGVILYHQTESPSPAAVVAALEAIDSAYADHTQIREFVPGDWGLRRTRQYRLERFVEPRRKLTPEIATRACPAPRVAR